jgi:hypothetical protein
MPIRLNVQKQTQLSGLPQANPQVFAQAGRAAADFGNSLQSLGNMGADYAAKQATLHNDNKYNEGILAFNQEQAAVGLEVSSGVLQPDGTRRRVDPDKVAIFAQEKLVTLQKTMAGKIPASRRSQFLKQTANSILTSTQSALKVGNDQIKSRAKGLNIQFKNSIMESLKDALPEQVEQLTVGYRQKLANGVLTNVYTEEESVTEFAKFQKELALTKLGQEESVLINSPDTTTEQIKQHLIAIDNSPLPPKDKPKRKSDVLTSMATLRRREEAQAAAIVKEVEESAFAYIALNMPDDNVIQQGEDVVTIPFIRHLESLGIIRDSNKINSYMKRLEASHAKSELPDGFEEKDALAQELQDIKSAALKPDILLEDANAVLDAYEKQVRELTVIAPFEFGQEEAAALLEKTNTFRTAINDRKTRLEEQNIEQARKDIEKLMVGNPMTKKFSAKEYYISRDAQNTVEMLVRSGVNPDVAVEKVLSTVGRSRQFADEFEADKAKELVLAAFRKSPREMTEDEIKLLEMMVVRNKADKGEKKRNPTDILKEAKNKANTK